MLLIDRLAEEQILSAIRRGDFDDLPGAGKPLLLEDDTAVPEALRSAYRLLKNAGCLPPELMLRNEISEIEGLLAQVEADEEALATRRRLCLLRARLAINGREFDLLSAEGEYRNQLLGRLAHDDNEQKQFAESPEKST